MKQSSTSISKTLERLAIDYRGYLGGIRKMNSIARIAIVACLAAMAQAQEHSETLKAPDCNSYTLQKSLTEMPAHLKFKQRFCLYAGGVVTGQAIFGAAFLSGVAQFRDDPVEWGQGTKGYLRRLGTRYGQGVAKLTGEFVASSLFREDLHYDPSKDSTFWKRTGHAFASTFVDRNVNGNPRPAYSKFVGAASSGAIGIAWYPQRLNRPVDVVSRSASAFGGYLASSIFQEFKDDIFRLVGKIFGSDRNVSSQPQASRGSK
jgi:hypothetical protein